MRLTGIIAILFCGTLVTSAGAQNRPPRAEEAESCLLNLGNGRWTPKNMPDMRRVFGTDASPVIQYAGRIDGMAAFVTDARCDSISYEMILAGPGSLDPDLGPFLSVLERIERETGFSNVGKLSQSDRFSLRADKVFEWEEKNADGDVVELGQILVEATELSVLIRARYINSRN